MTTIGRLMQTAMYVGTALWAGMAAADEVKVAAILSSTGTYAFVGVPLINGMRMADEELAASGGYGPHTLSISWDDNRSDRQEAITLLQRRVTSDMVDMVIGPISTAESMAAGPVAVELKVPLFTTAQSPDVLAIGDWIFKSTETPDSYMVPVADYIADALKPANCYLVSIQDNEGYVRQKNVFRDRLIERGVEITGDEAILAADTDFTALSTKLADAEPECLFVTAPPEQAANIMIQALQAGLSPDTIRAGDTGLGSANFLTAAGSAGEGVLFPATFVATRSDETRAFTAAYQAKFGVAPDHWAATGYSMMAVLASALRSIEGDVTREKLRDAMAATNQVPVVLGGGTITFDENRVPHFGGVVMRVQDGLWVEAK
ncbi:MAG: ABC transporter substrate-binding protein [Gemmobacter sp.]|nr:ABC transporter substrate-binding protein [Gemmobacter sp.]